MKRSPIKQKKCKCGCNKYPTLSCQGYNYACLPEDLKEKIGTKKQLQQKKLNAAKNIISKLRLAEYKKDAELAWWFKTHMERSEKVCENCGSYLGNYNNKDWFDSQHHVLEKSIFPSVATNIDNHVVLGKWCCHSQWHTSMFNASKMKIFSKCREIVKHLYPLLTPQEQGKISEYYEL